MCQLCQTHLAPTLFLWFGRVTTTSTGVASTTLDDITYDPMKEQTAHQNHPVEHGWSSSPSRRCSSARARSARQCRSSSFRAAACDADTGAVPAAPPPSVRSARSAPRPKPSRFRLRRATRRSYSEGSGIDMAGVRRGATVVVGVVAARIPLGLACQHSCPPFHTAGCPTLDHALDMVEAGRHRRPRPRRGPGSGTLVDGLRGGVRSRRRPRRSAASFRPIRCGTVQAAERANTSAKV